MKTKKDRKTRKDKKELNHPDVQSFLDFRSTLYIERPEEEKNDTAYRKNHNIASHETTDKYSEVPGFEAEVTRRLIKRLLELAQQGLAQNAVDVVEVIDGPKGRTEIHRGPETNACKAIYEIFGDFKPNAGLNELAKAIGKALPK